MKYPLALPLLCFLISSLSLAAEEAKKETLADQLAAYGEKNLAKNITQLAERLEILGKEVRKELQKVNDRESQLWNQIQTKADWEKYRDERIGKLKTSLGDWPLPPRARGSLRKSDGVRAPRGSRAAPAEPALVPFA